MLSLASSDASARLRKAKSSSSIQRRANASAQEGETTVHKHALAAAATAFERAHGFLQGKPNNRNQRVLRKGKGRESSEGSHFINRKNSSRSYERDVQKGSAAAKKLPSPERVLPMAPAQEQTIRRAQNLLDQEDELRARYTPEEPNDSVPSSYRRLRKLPSLYRPGVMVTAEKSRGNWSLDLPSSRRSRDTGPLDGGSSAVIEPHNRVQVDANEPSSSNHPGEEDPGVTSSAPKSNQSTAQQPRLRQRPSFILAPFKRPGRTFPTSPIPTTKVTYDNGEPDAADNDAPQRDTRARSVSQSLRIKVKGLKGFFRKSSNSSNGLPAQQVDASRPHFGNLIPRSSRGSEARDSAHVPDDESVLPTDSRAPSFGDVLPDAPPKSRTSSGRSGSEASNAKSRVTSWSNSTANNTLSSTRLSVINENVTALKSQTSLKATDSLQSGWGTLDMVARKLNGTIHTTRAASGQRQFSASRKLPAVSEAGMIMSGASKKENSIYDTLPSQNGADVARQSEEPVKKPTIRPVTPDDFQVTMSGIRIPAFAPQFDLPDIPAGATSFVQSPPLTFGSRVMHANDLGGPDPQIASPNDSVLPSPQQVATRLERSNNRWKTSLDEMARLEGLSSFTSTSKEPIRPAGAGYSGETLTVAKNRKHGVDYASYIRSTGERSIEKSGTGFGRHLANAVSPSVYSRDTDGHTPGRNDSAVSVAEREDAATTVINKFLAPTASESPEIRRKPKHNPHTEQAIDECMNWLSGVPASRDASKWDSEGVEHAEQVKSRHRREYAQIYEEERRDDVADDRSRQRSQTPSASTSRPALTTRQSSRMNERFPMLDTGKDLAKAQAKRAQKESSPAEGSSQKTFAKENTPSSAVSNQPELSRPKSMLSIGPTKRGGLSFTQYTTTANEMAGRDPANSASAHNFRYSSAQMVYRPRSALDLRKHSPSPYRHIRRKPVAATPLDEDTVKKIFEGPYGLPVTPESRHHKENSPAQTRRSIGSAAMDHSSEVSIGNLTPTGGHRMADIFLSTRRNGEESRLMSESLAFL